MPDLARFMRAVKYRHMTNRSSCAQGGQGDVRIMSDPRYTLAPQTTEIPMRALALPISRPSLTAASAVLLAGAVLFAASAAWADPPHRGGGRGHGHSHGQHIKHWKQQERHYHRNHYRASNYSSRFNHFTLNVGSPRPYYYSRPYYPRSYAYPVAVPYPVAQPYPVYTPVSTAPIQYGPVINSRDGRYCREYTQQVLVGGRVQESYGTACMQPDGDWQLES